jgi:hypothetical protein
VIVDVTKFRILRAEDFALLGRVRWSRFERQAAKVDLMAKRTIHHEDTQTIFG